MSQPTSLTPARRPSSAEDDAATAMEEEVLLCHPDSLFFTDSTNERLKEQVREMVPTLRDRDLRDLERLRAIEFKDPMLRRITAYRTTKTYIQTNHRELGIPETISLPFLDGLVECGPMHLGFHCLVEEMDKFCYCPLSLNPWMRRHRVPDYARCPCRRYRPGAFVAHVQAVAKNMEQKPVIRALHQILEYYLGQYYESYTIDGYKHKAFYPDQSPQFVKVHGAFWKEWKSTIDLGLTAIRNAEEERRTKEARKLELEEKKNLFRKIVDQEDVKRLEAIENGMKQLCINLGVDEDRRTREAAEEMLKPSVAKLRILEIKASTRLKRVLLCENSERAHFDLVPTEDDVAEILHCKSNRFLFPESGQEVRTGKCLLRGLKVEAKQADNGLSVKKGDKDDRAKDHGGPTRQFLSNFWKTLPKLSLPNKRTGEEFKLFERGPKYLAPCGDDFLKFRLTKEDLQSARTVFLSVGRMIGFCIFHHEVVSSNVLSPIHRNYLLRGISPTDPRYKLSHLLDDYKEMKMSNEEDIERALRGLLFDPIGGPDTPEARELLARKNLYEMRITDMDIFLKSMGDGIRLGAAEQEMEIHKLFENMPLNLVNDFLFGNPSFSVEELINVLHPVENFEGADVDSGRLQIGKENQNLFLRIENDKREGILVDLLREMSKDPAFPADFLCQCTGYIYLPATEFQVKIEFNYFIDDNYFPVAHTCDNTLKFPALVYGANVETLREKLQYTVKSFRDCKGAFSLQ